MIAFLYLFTISFAFITNLKSFGQSNVGKLGGFVSKNPATLEFSGSHVCDKYSTILKYGNNTDFPVIYNMYIVESDGNYTIDVYFKNLKTTNEFSLFNVTDRTKLETFNPVLVSTQENGIEVKLNMSKGLLCQFLYKFTVAYQLKSNSTESDKILLAGSCQLNERYYPEEYNNYISQGFKCMDYNSDFRFSGGVDTCHVQYDGNQCCQTYENDEIVSRQCGNSESYSLTTPVMKPTGL